MAEAKTYIDDWLDRAMRHEDYHEHLWDLTSFVLAPPGAIAALETGQLPSGFPIAVDNKRVVVKAGAPVPERTWAPKEKAKAQAKRQRGGGRGVPGGGELDDEARRPAGPLSKHRRLRGKTAAQVGRAATAPGWARRRAPPQGVEGLEGEEGEGTCKSD